MTPVNKIVIPYQMWLYKKAYERAVKNNPQHAWAIIIGADYQELLAHIPYKIP